MKDSALLLMNIVKLPKSLRKRVMRVKLLASDTFVLGESNTWFADSIGTNLNSLHA